ncbi:hypothetical protein BDR04DRAFT_1107982 [Suillus decipiens]|nr:hypothetical protein BDR04DRAFT_1107982 [Suillus decipiens]
MTTSWKVVGDSYEQNLAVKWLKWQLTTCGLGFDEYFLLTSGQECIDSEHWRNSGLMPQATNPYSLPRVCNLLGSDKSRLSCHVPSLPNIPHGFTGSLQHLYSICVGKGGRIIRAYQGTAACFFTALRQCTPRSVLDFKFGGGKAACTVNARQYHNQVRTVARGKSQSFHGVILFIRSAITIFTPIGRSAPGMAHASESWSIEIRFSSRITYGSKGIGFRSHCETYK